MTRYAMVQRPNGTAVLLLSLWIVPSVLTGIIYALFFHTLSAGGIWSVDKAKVTRWIGGAQAFGSSTVPLSTGRLDLGAWNGYHQVTTRTPLSYDDISFSFQAGTDAYIVLLFSGQSDRHRFVRLSTSRDMPSLTGYADTEGRFIDTEPVGITVEPNRVHAVRLSLAEHSHTVSVDGVTVYRGTQGYRDSTTFGFRGGERHVFVDNVTARRRNVTVLRDTFDRTWLIVKGSAIAAIVFAAIFGIVGIISRRYGKGMAYVLFAGVTATAVTGILTPAAAYYVGRYPDAPLPVILMPLKSPGPQGDVAAPVIADINHTIRERVKPGDFVIMFIGSSQTWGAGSTGMPARTYPYLVEAQLVRSFPDKRIVVINAGISGENADQLLDLYEHQWLPVVVPAITVIDLSNNDEMWGVPQQSYRAVMERFAALTKAAGGMSVFIPEPLSPEHPPNSIDLYRDTMRQVASSSGSTVIELHEYLKTRRNDGFLWWDWVHPTQYGYRLIAGEVAASLSSILR